MVTFGCSYSGMLSAFFRTRYPQLAQGAVAGSAPVEAILDFPQYDETVPTQSLLMTLMTFEIRWKMSLEAIVPLSLKLPLTILHPCGHHHLERKLSSKLLMSARISVLSNWLVTSSQKCLSLVYRLLSYTYPVRVWCATPSFANQADTQLKKKKTKKSKGHTHKPEQE